MIDIEEIVGAYGTRLFLLNLRRATPSGGREMNGLRWARSGMVVRLNGVGRESGLFGILAARGELSGSPSAGEEFFQGVDSSVREGGYERYCLQIASR